MKNTLSPHFHKAVFAAFLGALIVFILNLLISFAVHQELRLNWLTILVAALFAGLASYLTSLRRQVAELEERLQVLEYKVNRK